MAKVTKLKKHKAAKKKAAKPARSAKRIKSAKVVRLPLKSAKVVKLPVKQAKAGAGKDIDHFIKTSGLDTAREKEIGQHIGYRYDVNLVPDYARVTPFLKKYMEIMGWDDLNWLEDVHLGYEEGRAAIFDRNVNGWVTIPKGVKLPDNQQDRDMIARELLIKFQMSPRHPLIDLNKAYRKF
jgi:hypothetical protein